MFERTEEYLTKITLDAFERRVILDADVEIVRGVGKLRAYCKDTNTFLQFPKDIRQLGRRFKADVVKAKQSTGKVFFRAYPGSIRENKYGDIGEPIA